MATAAIGSANNFVQQKRTDRQGEILLHLIKSSGNQELKDLYEKELLYSTSTSNDHKKLNLEKRYKEYPPKRLNRSDVISNYERHRKQEWIAREEQATLRLNTNKSDGWIPPYEAHSLFSEEGFLTRGFDAESGGMAEEPLRFCHPVRLSDWEFCVQKHDFSGNIDLYQTLNLFMDEAIKHGFDKDQFETLLKMFVKEHYPAAWQGVRFQKSPDTTFAYCLTMINFGSLAVKATAAIRAIVRKPTDDLATIVLMFRELRAELYSIEHGDWDEEKCQDKATYAATGIIKEFVNDNIYKSMKEMKKKMEKARMKVTFKDLLDYCQKEELKTGNELTVTKDIKHYDPHLITNEISDTTQIGVNMTRAWTRSRGPPQNTTPEHRVFDRAGKSSERRNERREQRGRAEKRMITDRSSSTSPSPPRNSSRERRPSGGSQRGYSPRGRQPSRERGGSRHRERRGGSYSRDDRNGSQGRRGQERGRDRRYSGSGQGGDRGNDRRNNPSPHKRNGNSRERQGYRERQWSQGRDGRREQPPRNHDQRGGDGRRTPNQSPRRGDTPRRDSPHRSAGSRNQSQERACYFCGDGRHSGARCHLYTGNKAPDVCSVCFKGYHYRNTCKIKPPPKTTMTGKY